MFRTNFYDVITCDADAIIFDTKPMYPSISLYSKFKNFPFK